MKQSKTHSTFRRMIMTIIVTIELPVDPDKVTSVDVINRIKELIETDSLHFRWERDEVPITPHALAWNLISLPSEVK